MLEIEIIEVATTPVGFALMLINRNQDKVLPIFVGSAETSSISSALENEVQERPMTHDFMKNFMVRAGYSIEKIIIHDFQAGIFYAKILFISPTSEIIEIDSRPSDAISMAIRFKAPIFIDTDVYEKNAVERKILNDQPIKKDEFDEDEADEYIIDTSKMGEEATFFLNKFLDDLNIEEEKIDLIKKLLTTFPPYKNQDKKDSNDTKNFKTKIDVLKQMLSTAIQNEDYTHAAQLRDELLKLERSTKKKKK